jgi:hypothetical protein
LMQAASSWALWPSCATYLPRNSPSARTARSQNNNPRSLGRPGPPLKKPGFRATFRPGAPMMGLVCRGRTLEVPGNPRYNWAMTGTTGFSGAITTIHHATPLHYLDILRLLWYISTIYPFSCPRQA